MPLTDFYAHGKLLLTGEYYILDGAMGLAIPTRYGQRFTVRPVEEPSRYDLIWSVSDAANPEKVRNYSLHTSEWERPDTSEDPVRAWLLQLFYAAEQLRPGCTEVLKGKRVDCYLEFDPIWGLGSSSTLIYFLAGIFFISPYELLDKTFGGSGYDILCAAADGPVLFWRAPDGPAGQEISWKPDWLAQTYFVHLNRKQNSREGIAAYRKAELDPDVLEAINQISLAIAEPSLHLRAAAQLLERHEVLISKALKLPRVKEQFPNFPGTVKSLGAWGGDFIWALSEEPAEKVRAYFNERGYGTFIPYHDMAL